MLPILVSGKIKMSIGSYGGIGGAINTLGKEEENEFWQVWGYWRCANTRDRKMRMIFGRFRRIGCATNTGKWKNENDFL